MAIVGVPFTLVVQATSTGTLSYTWAGYQGGSGGWR
jgi:hypothetical protein